MMFQLQAFTFHGGSPRAGPGVLIERLQKVQEGAVLKGVCLSFVLTRRRDQGAGVSRWCARIIRMCSRSPVVNAP